MDELVLDGMRLTLIANMDIDMSNETRVAYDKLITLRVKYSYGL
jgi:hypothetical protein